MSVFDFFEKIVCINLDSRPERWQAAIGQFARAGIAKRVERFSGIVHERGIVGCSWSHQECIRRAAAEGLCNILIFEDDVVFTHPNFDPLQAALETLRTIDKWELFYLGARPVSTVHAVGRHLIRSGFLDTHSYAVNHLAFERIIAEPRDRIDVWYAENLCSYAVVPFLTAQAASYSDVLKTFSRSRKDFYDRELKRFSAKSAVVRKLYDLRYSLGVFLNRSKAGRLLHFIKDRVLSRKDRG